MGGVEWTAIPLMVEIFGIDDVEKFVVQLAALREHNQERACQSAT